MKETIRRIRKRKTWVNPTGWELYKGKWVILMIGFYFLSLISFFKAVSGISFVLLGIAVAMTWIYIKIRLQLKNRFKDIEEKFRMTGEKQE